MPTLMGEGINTHSGKWCSGLRSTLDLCLELDSSLPKPCGAEIIIGLAMAEADIAS